jgi:hypothetical protein
MSRHAPSGKAGRNLALDFETSRLHRVFRIFPDVDAGLAAVERDLARLNAAARTNIVE